VVRAIPTAALAEAQLPDFGQISIVPAAYVIGTFLGGAYAQLSGGPFERVQRLSLLGGLFGCSIGLAIYLLLLFGGAVV
jgi:hypothetical protein